MSDRSYDARGLLCPLPVLKARKLLMEMPQGATLTLLADDAIAVVDIPHFCTEAGHTLVSQTDDGSAQTYVIRRGA